MLRKRDWWVSKNIKKQTATTHMHTPAHTQTHTHTHTHLIEVGADDERHTGPVTSFDQVDGATDEGRAVDSRAGDCESLQ
jgi:hypothetical protein